MGLRLVAAERRRGLLPALTTARARLARLRADTTRNDLQGDFEEPWRGRLEGRPGTEVRFLDHAGILVMEDPRATVDRAVAAFVKRSGGE